MGLSINVLFAILWVTAGVIALRYFFGGYFRERGRAEVAAVAVVVAFSVGAYWPFSERIARAGGATPAPAAPAPSTGASMRDLSALCRATVAARGAAVGSFDILRAGGVEGAAVATGATLPAAQALSILGWAADSSLRVPAAGVCLLVDGRVDPSATVRFGGPRPDVAAAYRRDELLQSAFEVDIAPHTLRPGRHVLRIGALSASGSLGAVTGQRVVTVR